MAVYRGTSVWILLVQAALIIMVGAVALVVVIPAGVLVGAFMGGRWLCRALRD